MIVSMSPMALGDERLMSVTPQSRWVFLALQSMVMDRAGDESASVSCTAATADRLGLSSEALEQSLTELKRAHLAFRAGNSVCMETVYGVERHRRLPGPERIDLEDADLKAFEQIWKARPKRAGSDPKTSARSAYRARRKQGHSAVAMYQGMKRYYRYCCATGANGTQYVMRTERFLGPRGHFQDAWEVPKPKQEDLSRSLSNLPSRSVMHVCAALGVSTMGKTDRVLFADISEALERSGKILHDVLPTD